MTDGARQLCCRCSRWWLCQGIANSLGLGDNALEATDSDGFTGPVPGSRADAEQLARACWFLALLTEAFRAGPVAVATGPLRQFLSRQPSVDEVLNLAPLAVLIQLSSFRRVFETVLIPRLATRSGYWALGPTFAGSALLNADADLIAAGLLIDLKTSSAKPSLGLQELFQIIGYALLDFDDAYQITEAGIFNARYAYLSTWDADELLDELAGHPVKLTDTRESFRQLLDAC